jgi:Domain of Unknown Function (DUF928)
MKRVSRLLQFPRLSTHVPAHRQIRAGALGLLAMGLLLGSAMVAQAGFRPSPRGIPAIRVSGGTRDPKPPCVIGSGQLMTAISPEENLGLTTEAYPTFQWYMPQNTLSYVEFSLSEVDLEQDIVVPIYKSSFRVSGEEGIASLTLPDTIGIPPLTEGKTYAWSVSAFCQENGDQADMYVEGWVERTTPTELVSQALAQATTPLERAQVAANHSLWFDATAALSEQLIANPRQSSDARTEWQALLESVELGAIATKPFVEE